MTSAPLPVPSTGIPAAKTKPATRAARKRKPFPKFRQRDTFQSYMKSRVDRYLRATGKTPYGGGRMIMKSVTIFLWVIASYAALLLFGQSWFVAVPAIISLAFAVAAVGFNIQHDAGHKAYTSGKTPNRFIAFSLDLMGASSYIWNIKHNKLHHTFTNIEGHDDDINVGILGRLSPEQPRLWFHRFQHYYLFVLYAALAVKWQLMDDFRDVIRARIGNFPIARPKGWELFGFLFGKAFFLTFAFVIPILVVGWPSAILGYLAAMGLCGVIMSVVFQLAHVVEPAAYPVPNVITNEMDNAWAVHQAHTTVDFAPKSRIATWLCGGLNFQTEHHLFPHISHLHYPRLARIVQHACERFDVPYNVYPTFLSAVASHYRQLRRLGQPA